jgi:hypothetical protein
MEISGPSGDGICFLWRQLPVLGRVRGCAKTESLRGALADDATGPCYAPLLLHQNLLPCREWNFASDNGKYQARCSLATGS